MELTLNAYTLAPNLRCSGGLNTADIEKDFLVWATTFVRPYQCTRLQYTLMNLNKWVVGFVFEQYQPYKHAINTIKVNIRGIYFLDLGCSMRMTFLRQFWEDLGLDLQRSILNMVHWPPTQSKVHIFMTNSKPEINNSTKVLHLEALDIEQWYIVLILRRFGLGPSKVNLEHVTLIPNPEEVET